MVVTKVAIFWQVENSFVFHDLISFVVLNLNDTLFDEVHFFNIRLVLNHCLTWAVDSAEHRNDQFVDEASLTIIKEMIE